MFRASGLLCACLAVALGGCVFNVGSTRVDVAVKVDERAINASLDAATARLQAELERRGLQVAVSQHGDSVRVVSQTRAGDRFTLVLTKQPTPSGKEQTRVRVEWEKAPDKDLWLALVLAAGATALQAQK